MVSSKLREKVRTLINNIGLSTCDLYKKFMEVKEELPDTKEDTFKRVVRDEVMKKQNETKEVSKEEAQVQGFYIDQAPIVMIPMLEGVKCKRILLTADWHCGHRAALCTPTWFQRIENERLGKFGRIQSDLWSLFSRMVTQIKAQHPIDHLIVNADIIDGNQKITSGAEAITTDRNLQTEIAKEIIEFINPTDKIFFTVGSPYHTGKSEDWEEVLADKVGAIIKDEHYIDVMGKLLHIKHDIAGTSVPYGKLTPLVKQSILEDLKSIKYNDRQVDMVIRSHVHFFAEFRLGNKRGIITPCFQLKSKFGTKKCDGTIDIGMVVIDIYENGHIVVNPYLATIKDKEKEIIYC